MKTSRTLALQFSAFSFIIIAIMAGLVAYYSYHIPPQSADQPVVPTKTISASQGIGGVQDTSSSKQSEGVTTTSKKPTGPPVASRSANSSSSAIPSDLSSAPKQAEVAKTVTKEYEYRALQTPNDPMFSTFTDGVGNVHTPFALQRLAKHRQQGSILHTQQDTG